MKVVIVGSGNVAESLAQALAESSVCLGGIVARNRERGERIASLCGCGFYHLSGQLPDADLYIVSVRDNVVKELTATMNFSPQSVVAHTAGGISVDAVEHCHRAVIYPLQTFTASRRVDMHHVPLFVEASDELSCEVAQQVASAISDRVVEADSEVRLRLHVAAVFACNFVNRMYGLGAEIMEQGGLDFEMLKPLINETAAKALSVGNPACVQTGPAVRGDSATMGRHLGLIAEDEFKSELYKMLSKNIWETSKKI